jgi:hypothetical protein
MKKSIILMCFLVFAFVLVNAQNTDIIFGAKAGLNLASISGDDTDDFDSRTSFHAGAMAEFKISEKFSFQPELLYSGQGAKFENSESGEFGSFSEEVEINLDYLNIPLMAKYYITEGFSLEAGPQVGFLLSAKEKYEYNERFGDETFSESGEEDIKDFVKNVDFGLSFGLGYKLQNGLNFSARYYLGLSDINDFEESRDVEFRDSAELMKVQKSQNIKNQNNVFQLSVGYFF